MHSEQTNGQTFFFIWMEDKYIDTLEVKFLDKRVVSNPKTAQRGKSGKRVVEMSRESRDFVQFMQKIEKL